MLSPGTRFKLMGLCFGWDWMQQGLQKHLLIFYILRRGILSCCGFQCVRF